MILLRPVGNVVYFDAAVRDHAGRDRSHGRRSAAKESRPRRAIDSGLRGGAARGRTAACVIDGSAANHVMRVLRLRDGDSLTLFDGRGGEYGARITSFRKTPCRLKSRSIVTSSGSRALDLTLAQGISRGERMDWVMQKATELGVTRIIPGDHRTHHGEARRAPGGKEAGSLARDRHRRVRTVRAQPGSGD